jgi:hypothetical protein
MNQKAVRKRTILSTTVLSAVCLWVDSGGGDFANLKILPEPKSPNPKT